MNYRDYQVKFSTGFVEYAGYYWYRYADAFSGVFRTKKIALEK